MKNYRVIDAHAHIFPEKIAEKATESIGRYYGIEMDGSGTISDLLEKGRKINVCKYIVHSTATKVEQVETINNFVAGVQEENKCFIGFGTLHPGLENVEKEVDRVISLNLKGIKLHPEFQGFSIDDREMMPVYKAIEGKLPMLMHMGDENKTSSSPRKLARVMELFPGLTIIAAHFGGYRMWDESMQYLVGKNVYFDTSSSLPWINTDKAEDIIRRHGADKILFGTDYPMWTHADELERFLRLQLTEEERELILSGNVCRLLGIS